MFFNMKQTIDKEQAKEFIKDVLGDLGTKPDKWGKEFDKVYKR